MYLAIFSQVISPVSSVTPPEGVKEVEKKANEVQEKTPTDNLAAIFTAQVVKAEGEANSVNPAPVASDPVSKEGVKEVKEEETALEVLLDKEKEVDRESLSPASH